MAYSPTTWATGDTVTATKMNKLEQGVANTDYDIIIDAGSSFEQNIANYTVVKFDVDSVKSKIEENEIVKGVCFRHYNYDTLVDGDTDMSILPLTDIGVWHSEGLMVFSSFALTNKQSASALLYATRIVLVFNANSGALTGINNFCNQSFSINVP